jgi:LPS-assembly protein
MVRYDVEAARINATSVGLGYIDDCFAIRVTYTTSYGYAINQTSTPVHTALLQISLRTLGTTRFSQRVDTLPTITDPTGTLHF